MKKVLIGQLSEETMMLRFMLLCLWNPVVGIICAGKFNKDYKQALLNWKKLPSYRSLLEALHVYAVKVNRKTYFVDEKDIDMLGVAQTRVTRECDMGNVPPVKMPCKAVYVF